MSQIESVCVFCGSNFGTHSSYREAARKLGNAMAARQLGLVYGGGSVGLMGEIANTVMEAKGKVSGIIPEALFAQEVGHKTITHLEVVDNMHTRKARMAELCDAFIAMPGGIGTLEELFEVWTWLQLGYHHKPVGLLNINGFYDQLLAFLDHATEQGLIRPEARKLLLVSDNPVTLLDMICQQEAQGSAQLEKI